MNRSPDEIRGRVRVSAFLACLPVSLLLACTQRSTRPEEVPTLGDADIVDKQRPVLDPVVHLPVLDAGVDRERFAGTNVIIAGPEETADAQLSPEPTYDIAGSIVSAEGKPLGARISISIAVQRKGLRITLAGTPQDRGSPVSFSGDLVDHWVTYAPCLTDRDGKFHIQGLPAGEHRWTVAGGEGCSLSGRLRVGPGRSNQLVIRLEN